MISVRQARGLPVVSLFPHPASFRFHLTVDTLAFGYILPTTGRIQDFHLLEMCAARHTKIRPFLRNFFPGKGLYSLIHLLLCISLQLQRLAGFNAAFSGYIFINDHNKQIF